MNKIKVIHCLGKLDTGGAETLVFNIFNKIDKSKFQFDFLVFSTEPGVYDNDIKRLGGKIYYLPSMSKCGLEKYIKNLTSFFRSQQPDIVHSHMDWQGGFIAYAANKANISKIIVHSHANQHMFERNFLHKLFIKISKILINKNATDCLACSKIAGESLFNKPFSIIYNGIDIDRFYKVNKKKIDMLKEEFRLKNEDILLGCIGGLSNNKNQIFLIDILNNLVKINSNYKLLLVGEGIERKNIETKVDEYNLTNNVYFAGIRRDIPEIMSLLDVFVLPSKMEGFGIVAIEAQVSGVPCIISDAVPKEIAINKNILFLPLLSDLWTVSILNLKKKKEKIDYNMINNSKFSLNKTCEELVKIYSN